MDEGGENTVQGLSGRGEKILYATTENFLHLTSEKGALHHILTMQEEGPILRKQASAISL